MSQDHKGGEGYRVEACEDGAWCLIRVADGEEIFCDAMEPEDARLVRDLKPLVDELNRLATRARAAEEERTIADSVRRQAQQMYVDKVEELERAEAEAAALRKALREAESDILAAYKVLSPDIDNAPDWPTTKQRMEIAYLLLKIKDGFAARLSALPVEEEEKA